MGPYPPSSISMHMNLCSGCGARSTYHMSVEGTFIDGQVDRFFGIVFGVTTTSAYYVGISPWQFYIVAEYHADGDWWEARAFEWSGAVNASYATNTFEVTVQPAAQAGMVDTFVYLNDLLIFTLYNRPAADAQVGLAMDYHDVTVNYDNWLYEEIEVGTVTCAALSGYSLPGVRAKHPPHAPSPAAFHWWTLHPHIQHPRKG